MLRKTNNLFELVQSLKTHRRHGRAEEWRESADVIECSVQIEKIQMGKLWRNLRDFHMTMKDCESVETHRRKGRNPRTRPSTIQSSSDEFNIWNCECFQEEIWFMLVNCVRARVRVFSISSSFLSGLPFIKCDLLIHCGNDDDDDVDEILVSATKISSILHVTHMFCLKLGIWDFPHILCVLFNFDKFIVILTIPGMKIKNCYNRQAQHCGMLIEHDMKTLKQISIYFLLLFSWALFTHSTPIVAGCRQTPLKSQKLCQIFAHIFFTIIP